ncbi:MAG TPA: type II toxin-antitoxin system RelE/ParE family toxin [Bryobacteraceae bacterium]|jgi:toxin ParE1/3/4|nr:type II toxin-antitoxin system RelE/ParE family toxin [Bryobacteraceae bacterium]
MKRLRVSHHAKRDLDSIWRYVANDANSIEVADRIVESVTVHFAMLARQPHAGNPGVRSFPSGNYLIYYRESRTHLVISRILHGKRDQLGAWNESE